MNHAESKEQKTLIEWARMHPIIKGLIFSIRNEGKMSPQAGIRANKMGRIAGVSDLFLPYPTLRYHGLWIEMKSQKTGKIRPKTTKEQKEWLDLMRAHGYAASVCYGWIDAKEVIEAYIHGG